jgi:hypothetical protein
MDPDHDPYGISQEKNGEGVGGGEEGPGLPTTLQEFSANNKATSQTKIFDPPKAPDNPKETAPQR